MTILRDVLSSDLAAVASRSQEVDCLVIGSGTAGVTTAVELAGSGIEAVILEAGPLVTLTHMGNTALSGVQDLVGDIHQRVAHRTSWVAEHELTAGTAVRKNNTAWSNVGGRTIFWNGMTPRFGAHDFHNWPMALDEFSPWYDRAEQLINVCSVSRERPPFFQSPMQQTVIDRLGSASWRAQPAPLALDTAAIVNGHVTRGFDSSIARLLRSRQLVRFGEKPGIALVPEAVVLSLVADGERIAHTRVLDRRTGKVHEVRARNVVLACGGTQSARLALASGLDKVSDHVGRHITDHIFVHGKIDLGRPLPSYPVFVLVPGTEQRPFQFHLRGPYRDRQAYTTTKSTEWHEFHPDGTLIEIYSFGVAPAEYGNRVALRQGHGDDSSGLFDYCVVCPRSPGERATIQAIRDSMQQIAELLGGRMIEIVEGDPGTALHEIGGLRMGLDPQTSVTDPFGRFWKVRNLYVADAAAWPGQGAANPYLTITAWALRCADAIRRGR